MEIAKDKVVLIDYTLKNNEGDVLDTSIGAEPLPYIHGAGDIILGLEKALEGRKIGDTFNVKITPEDAYGDYQDALVQDAPKEEFANKQYSSTIASSTYDLSTLGFQSNYPTIGIGGAFILSSSTLFAMDVTYMISPKSSNQFPTQSTLNLAFGVEHYLLTFAPLRAGVYTNNSYYPDGKDGDHLNGLGFTCSIGYESGANSLSLGVETNKMEIK